MQGQYTSIERQLPPHSMRGLVSKLHLNSAYRERRAALVSSLDTSGRTDKTPVLTQSCRMSSVLIVMFNDAALQSQDREVLVRLEAVVLLVLIGQRRGDVLLSLVGFLEKEEK